MELQSLAQAEKEHIEKVLKASSSKTQAAITLGITIKTLYNKLRVYKIAKDLCPDGRLSNGNVREEIAKQRKENVERMNKEKQQIYARKKQSAAEKDFACMPKITPHEFDYAHNLSSPSSYENYLLNHKKETYEKEN